MKKFYKKAKTNVRDLLRPSSRQSTQSSPAQTPRISQDPENVQDIGHDISTAPRTTVQASQSAIGPVSSAKPSAEPDNLHPDVIPQPAPIGALEPAPLEPTAIEVTHSNFDKLRDAMEEDGANLFAPLQVALVDLVALGRSLEAC